jgi:hypothetical protein
VISAAPISVNHDGVSPFRAPIQEGQFRKDQIMAQMSKARIITTTGLMAGLVAGIPAWAQTNAPPDQGSGMMQRERPSGEGMKPGMMMDPEMRQKMSRMMDNCNRMMDSMTPSKDDSGPSAPNRS